MTPAQQALADDSQRVDKLYRVASMVEDRTLRRLLQRFAGDLASTLPRVHGPAQPGCDGPCDCDDQ